jgi:RNA-splicing ligase RtcB
MSKRLTIALNINRNQRTILLLPPNSTGEAIRLAIEKVASTRLRTKLKKSDTSRIYIADNGTEVSNEALGDIPEDTLLLFSTKEDYIGKTITSPSTNPSNTYTSVNLAKEAYVEPDAFTQLESAAKSLPGTIHTVAQPDLHPGNKFPIGAVLVSKGWIHPPLIGGDIGCGMGWYRLKMGVDQLDGDKGRRIAEKLRGLEGAWMGEEDRRLWIGGDVDGIQDFEGNKALGTIGAGNHFAEIQVVGPTSPNCPLQENEVVILVHSGSRGYGGDILKRHSSSKDQLSFPDTSHEAINYLKEHDYACEWAVANRDLIAFRFLGCLEPGNTDWTMDGLDDIVKARERVRSRKVVDIWHNNMQKAPWGEEGEEVWIHRKGAAPTHDPSTHQPLPILPLPGSRATPTAILRALPDPPINNAFSVAHGAGRAMTRTKALQSLPGKYGNDHDKVLRGGSSFGGGTWVVCEDKKLVWEEAPDAYKDIKAVANDLAGYGLVEIMGWCEPRVSYKVRTE